MTTWNINPDDPNTATLLHTLGALGATITITPNGITVDTGPTATEAADRAAAPDHRRLTDVLGTTLTPCIIAAEFVALDIPAQEQP